MSSRCLPVAARLTKRHLRFLARVERGDHMPPWIYERDIKRLVPLFVTRPHALGKSCEITDDGRAALRAYRARHP